MVASRVVSTRTLALFTRVVVLPEEDIILIWLYIGFSVRTLGEPLHLLVVQ